ncbi:hypothetical protein SAMN02910353_01321 [Ruminococcus sp. YRD2003]|uniref:hypothetical protein n=1 Tax=Ruminococcus sp. YRD2003 TaxID=1452313 RepID=UPI0008C10BA6|nr:hypothetical protein SAMN02910353_01321 [Ruminococcus flavefaciens]
MPKKNNQAKEQPKKQDANANQNAQPEAENKTNAPDPSKIIVIPPNADSADKKLKLSEYEKDKFEYDKQKMQKQQMKAKKKEIIKQKNDVENIKKQMKEGGYNDKEIAAEIKRKTQKITLGLNNDTLTLINDCFKKAATDYGYLKPKPEHKPILEGICNSINAVKNSYNKLLDVEKERAQIRQSGKKIDLKKKVELEQKYKRVFFDMKRSTKLASETMKQFVSMDINRPHGENNTTPEMDDERAFMDSATQYLNVVRGFSSVRENKLKEEREAQMKKLPPQAQEVQLYLEAKDAIYSTSQELSNGLLTFRGKPQYTQVCRAVSAVANSYKDMIEAEKKYEKNNNGKTRSEYEKALRAMQKQVNDAKRAAAGYNEYKKATGNWGAHASKNASKRINAVAKVDLLAENVSALINTKLNQLKKIKEQGQPHKDAVKGKSIK